MAQYTGVSQIETNSVSVTGGVCGPGVDSANTHLTFDLPLRTSLVPKYCRGNGTPTFTRASNAYVADHEGILRLARSGEVRFQGARRVANGLRYTEDFTNVVWGTYGGFGSLSVTSGKTDPLGGSTAWEITPSGGANGFLQNVSASRLSISGNYPAGSVACSSVWMRVTSGTKTVYIYAQGTDNTWGTVVVDTTWRRYCYVDSTCGGKELYFILQYSGDLQVWHPQLELLTGASNQSPSEYVSSDVLSAPYHGAGVDGVKYFDTTNGNSVASNVVTEATGAPIAEDTLRGYLSEPPRDNICLYSIDYTNAAWVKTNVSVTAGIAGAPDGGPTATTLTATADNATIIQDLGTVSSKKQTGSIWIKRRTGSGNVYLTLDGVATWTTIGVSATWNLLSTTQTLADPDFGIRLTTNGDAVDVWNSQVENGGIPTISWATSSIKTTSTTGSRDGDSLTFAVSGNISANTGTAYAEDFCTDVNYWSFRLIGGGYAPMTFGYTGLGRSIGVFDGVSHPAVTASGTDLPVRATTTWSKSQNKKTPYANGAAGLTHTFAGFTFDPTIKIGGAGVDESLNYPIRNIRIWSAVMPILTDGT